jgi:hypothetical protein
MAFFLDNIGARGIIDCPLYRGPAIILDIDRSGKLNKTSAKFLLPLAIPFGILDIPQFAVDFLQRLN